MKISVEIVANTGSFVTDTKRASKAAEKAAKEIQDSFKRIGTAIGAGIAAGATALVYMTKKAIDAADEISKLAQKTGLSTEALSQLQYAAGLSGVEDLGASLTKFNRSIAEAAQGSAAQVEAFKALGISVRNTDGSLKDTETLFGEVATAFTKLGDGAAKTSYAVALFGKSGADLIPLLNSGAAGLAEMRKEADALGLTIDEKTGKAAEGFNDNLTRLGSVVTGIGTRLASQFAPELERITGLMVQTAKDTGSVTKATDILATAFKGLVLAGVAVGNVFTIVGESIASLYAAQTALLSGNLKGALAALHAGGEDIQGDIADIGKAYAGLFGEIEKGQAKAKVNGNTPPGLVDKEALKASQKAADEARKEAEKSLKESLDAEEKQRESIASIIDALKDESATMGLNTAQIEARKLAKLGATAAEQEQAVQLAQYIELQKAEIKQTEDIAAVYKDTRTPREQYAAELERLNKLFDSGKRDSELYNRAIAGAHDAFKKAEEAAKKSTDTMSVYAEQAARNMQDAFADFLFNPFDKGLKGMLASFADTLQRMAAEAAAAKIFDSLGFGAKSGSGGSGGSGFFDFLKGIGSSIYGAFSGGSTSATGTVTRDVGGYAKAGQAIAIGTGAQPELFIPQTAGNFVPRDQWMRGGGDTHININTSITAPSGTVGRQTLDQVSSAALTGAQRATRRDR